MTTDPASHLEVVFTYVDYQIWNRFSERWLRGEEGKILRFDTRAEAERFVWSIS